MHCNKYYILFEFIETNVGGSQLQNQNPGSDTVGCRIISVNIRIRLDTEYSLEQNTESPMIELIQVILEIYSVIDSVFGVRI